MAAEPSAPAAQPLPAAVHALTAADGVGATTAPAAARPPLPPDPCLAAAVERANAAERERADAAEREAAVRLWLAEVDARRASEEVERRRAALATAEKVTEAAVTALRADIEGAPARAQAESLMDFDDLACAVAEGRASQEDAGRLAVGVLRVTGAAAAVARKRRPLGPGAARAWARGPIPSSTASSSGELRGAEDERRGPAPAAAGGPRWWLRGRSRSPRART